MPEIVGRSGIVRFMALLTLYAVHRPAVANLHLLAIKRDHLHQVLWISRGCQRGPNKERIR